MKHPKDFYRPGATVLFSTPPRTEVGSGSRTQPSRLEHKTLEAEAEDCAYLIDPRGCTCPNNGAVDCPWCEAKWNAESHLKHHECVHCGSDLCKHGYCTYAGCGDACLPCIKGNRLRVDAEREAEAAEVIGILMAFDTEVGHA